MADSFSMPGDREAAGAIAAMQDTYGRHLAVGVRVVYRLDGMGPSEWEAGIIDTVGSGLLSVEVEGGDGLLRAVPITCILPL